ncbi:MAG TPA: sigma-54 dependent transcriptional regulator [Terriglobales bacterium]|nr:sigma-54 dependent transcriptional regulator [Terriglobales bacterium]
MGRILIVVDEPEMRRNLASNLRQDRHEVSEAAGVEEARRILLANGYDAVLTDQRMADGEGLEVLHAARENDPSLSVVFLTTVASPEWAVESVRQGAFDFLARPLQPEVLRATTRRACQHTALLRENVLLKDALVRLEGASELYGESSAMQAVREEIARVAPTNVTVLITGETGTGKELVARAIHRHSLRSSKPFIALNCAAFTETLLESELFGHEKGAFTGADGARQGLFEAAHEGTLFLDEAGEMSLAAQAKLLRVLTDGQLLRVGSTKTRAVDVRVLVATHRDLRQRVRDGRFREDLYCRLALVPIHIPPLRGRLEDIPGFCDLLSRQVATELKLPVRTISTGALDNLKQYQFPGNVRELKNLIERAYILTTKEEIGAEDLALTRPGAAGADRSRGNGGHATPMEGLPQPFDLSEFLDQTEKELIVRTLASTGGAQAEAARRLGLSRSALAYKLTKYGIRGNHGWQQQN